MSLPHLVSFQWDILRNPLYIVTCWLLLCSDSSVAASLLPAEITAKRKRRDVKSAQGWSRGAGQTDKQKKYARESFISW